MRILLTNDDGYLAKGINAVFKALINAGHEVIVVAPEHNLSGSSQSIAVYEHISIKQIKDNIYFVNSSPADCVRLGLQFVYGSAENYPDLVVSGINHGENICEDVNYSGTVGAACEGMIHNIPSLAFSTAGPNYNNMHSAAKIVVDLIVKLTQEVLAKPFVWNINVPNKPYNKIKGYQATKLGKRPAHYPFIEQVTPRGKIIYWQGESSIPLEGEYGTDLEIFLKNEIVSITPLNILPTDTAQLPVIESLIN